MAARKTKIYLTHFSDGKFEKFCRIQDKTLESVAEISGVAPRTIQRWLRGETVPQVGSLAGLAKAFGFADADEFHIAYGRFLESLAAEKGRGSLVGEKAVPYQRGLEAMSSEQVREALQPLRAILDLDLSQIRPQKRRDLFLKFRQRILLAGSLLEAEYLDFLGLFEN